MFDKPPESGGFKFCSGFVVNRNVRGLVLLRKLVNIRWVLSQILPYRGANGADGRDSAADCLYARLPPLTVPAGLREIVNDLI